MAQPRLARSLDELAALDAEDPAFMDALEQYGGQAQRMGEAAEMAGFPGLQAVCNHVLENTLAMPMLAARRARRAGRVPARLAAADRVLPAPHGRPHRRGGPGRSPGQGALSARRGAGAEGDAHARRDAAAGSLPAPPSRCGRCSPRRRRGAGHARGRGPEAARRLLPGGAGPGALPGGPGAQHGRRPGRQLRPGRRQAGGAHAQGLGRHHRPARARLARPPPGGHPRALRAPGRPRRQAGRRRAARRRLLPGTDGGLCRRQRRVPAAGAGRPAKRARPGQPHRPRRIARVAAVAPAGRDRDAAAPVRSLPRRRRPTRSPAPRCGSAWSASTSCSASPARSRSTAPPWRHASRRWPSARASCWRRTCACKSACSSWKRWSTCAR